MIGMPGAPVFNPRWWTLLLMLISVPLLQAHEQVRVWWVYRRGRV